MNIETALKEINALEDNPRTASETDESWIRLNTLQGYRRLIVTGGEVPVVKIEFSDGHYICKERKTGRIISRKEANKMLHLQFDRLYGK